MEMQKLNDAKTFLEHTLGPDKYNEQRHQIFQLIKLSFDPARQTEAENKLFLTLADEKHKEMIDAFEKQKLSTNGDVTNFLINDKDNLWPRIGCHKFGTCYDPYGLRPLSIETIKERNVAIRTLHKMLK